MRITGGELGGRRIAAPSGGETRPTADRVRESLFAVLGPLDGVVALDLFAGSGALGLEALSRGAASAVLVERSPNAIEVIRRNVAALGVEDRVRIVPRDWRAALRAEAARGSAVGLCLMDPPYSLLPRIAGRLGAALAPVLAPGAVVVAEHERRRDGPQEPLELTDLPIVARTVRVYGDTAVSILRLAARPGGVA